MNCKCLFLAEQNANAASVLIFVVFIFQCFCHALKAPNMNSLCQLSALSLKNETIWNPSELKRKQNKKNTENISNRFNKKLPRTNQKYSIHLIRTWMSSACLQVYLKMAEKLKWGKEENGTSELESDLFIESFDGERTRVNDCSELQSEGELVN